MPTSTTKTPAYLLEAAATLAATAPAFDEATITAAFVALGAVAPIEQSPAARRAA
jgi:hypothetical protein